MPRYPILTIPFCPDLYLTHYVSLSYHRISGIAADFEGMGVSSAGAAGSSRFRRLNQIYSSKPVCVAINANEKLLPAKTMAATTSETYGSILHRNARNVQSACCQCPCQHPSMCPRTSAAAATSCVGDARSRRCGRVLGNTGRLCKKLLREGKEIPELLHHCPLCRSPCPDDDEEDLSRLFCRMEMGDAAATRMMATYYLDGLYGVEKDHKKAFLLVVTK